MPLLIRLSLPSKNALLLDGSSQDKVPGMNVLYSSRANSSAACVSGELTATLPSLSTILPPCDHSSQCAKALPSSTACPSAKPAGVPLALSAWHSLRKPSVSSGKG